MVRLKQPSLSPDRESAPHWRTTALGWYISITLAMIFTDEHRQLSMILPNITRLSMLSRARRVQKNLRSQRKRILQLLNRLFDSLQQLQNGQDDVVDVTKPRSL
ncbi:unnamed protein product [Menidia menidia]|uniref:(Atlantic silverside) hypothetical protein n=1 Tax=Menidia menidia TaxID=238744 RepID=A0A8S4AE96_9TELE|nr:unnamed protein product [Menidia menidia]